MSQSVPCPSVPLAYRIGRSFLHDPSSIVNAVVMGSCCTNVVAAPHFCPVGRSYINFQRTPRWMRERRVKKPAVRSLQFVAAIVNSFMNATKFMPVAVYSGCSGHGKESGSGGSVQIKQQKFALIGKSFDFQRSLLADRRSITAFQHLAVDIQ